MTCNDCGNSIESCSCSFWGGRKGSEEEKRIREFFLPEQKRQETKALLKRQHEALRPKKRR